MRVLPVEINWNSSLSVYASEPFLKAVGDEYGWLGCFDDERGLLCVLPYTIVRKAFFRMVRFRVETIPFVDDFDVKDEKEFLNETVRYFRSVKADMIIPATTNAIFRTYPDGASAAPYGTYIVDLGQSEEALFGRLSSSHRRKVRLATKQGIEIRSGIEYLGTAYDLVRDTFGRSRMGFMSLKSFGRFVEGLGGNIRILVALHQGVVQGAIVVPFSNHSAHYVYGGSVVEPVAGAMNLLHWEAIRQFRQMGVRRYDFVGARINPEKGSKQEGLAQFKQRFGGTLVQGFMWKYPIRPVKYVAYALAVLLLRQGDIVDQERRRLKRSEPNAGRLPDRFGALMPASLRHNCGILRREITRKIDDVGVGGTLKLCAKKAFTKVISGASSDATKIHNFDLKYGTETSGIIEPGALDIPLSRVSSAVRYQSAIIDVFTEMLNDLTIKHEDFVFIDLGSGKGRALLLASRFPFKRIIGVELSRQLHDIACRNVEIYADEGQRCRQIEPVCSDVTDFMLPNENTVFYLFNPFSDEVLRPVVSRMEESFRQCPRDICVVYLKPVHRYLLDAATFLRTYKENERYVIYCTDQSGVIGSSQVLK